MITIMTKPTRSLILAIFLTAGLASITTISAQSTPTAAEMMEQLKVPPFPAPHTRGRRNLTVEAADTTPTARSSLSLLIEFDFNSAKVKSESQQALSNLAQALQSKELDESKFAVEGHTDAKGRAYYNLKLSQQRADAVRAFLTSNGVADNRLQSIGKGFGDLANTADPLAAENRRVRIINLN